MRFFFFILSAALWVSILSCGSAGTSQHLKTDENGWTDDYEGGLKVAKASGKKALVLFTGSDWCRPCMFLESKVFQSEEFKALTKDFVLIRLDFPRRHPIDPEIKKRNRSLGNNYGVRGYPTVVALGPDGKEITRWVGFRPSDKDKYIANLKGLLSK